MEQDDCVYCEHGEFHTAQHCTHHLSEDRFYRSRWKNLIVSIGVTVVAAGLWFLIATLFVRFSDG